MRNDSQGPRPGDGKPKQRPGGPPQRHPGGGNGRPTPPQNQPQRQPPKHSPAPISAKTEQRTPAPRRELPMLVGANDVPEPEIEGMTYIAYGETEEDYGFELTDSLEEALEILEAMREDGFKTKLFQAQEIEVVRE